MSGMPMISVRRWNEELDGPLTERRISGSYSPPGKYRASVYRYPAGALIDGSMRASTCYVLDGACHFKFAAEEAALRTGDVALLPEGPYDLAVGQDGELS